METDDLTFGPIDTDATITGMGLSKGKPVLRVLRADGTTGEIEARSLEPCGDPVAPIVFHPLALTLTWPPVIPAEALEAQEGD